MKGKKIFLLAFISLFVLSSSIIFYGCSVSKQQSEANFLNQPHSLKVWKAMKKNNPKQFNVYVKICNKSESLKKAINDNCTGITSVIMSDEYQLPKPQAPYPNGMNFNPNTGVITANK